MSPPAPATVEATLWRALAAAAAAASTAAAGWFARSGLARPPPRVCAVSASCTLKPPSQPLARGVSPEPEAPDCSSRALSASSSAMRLRNTRTSCSTWVWVSGRQRCERQAVGIANARLQHSSWTAFSPRVDGPAAPPPRGLQPRLFGSPETRRPGRGAGRNAVSQKEQHSTLPATSSGCCPRRRRARSEPCGADTGRYVCVQRIGAGRALCSRLPAWQPASPSQRLLCGGSSQATSRAAAGSGG